MRIPARPRTRGVGAILATIGAAFQLVIFLLVASLLAGQEASPSSPGNRRDGPAATIDVSRDRRLALAGAPVAAEELEERLGSLRAEAGDTVQVRVRVDGELPYEALEPALLACARAGFGDVQIAIVGEEGAP